MSVFTTVHPHELEDWLKDYPLGDLLDLKGIASGITNTNYFVTTTNGRFVLTLFEKNSHDELHYYLDLMAFLADHGVPAPHPVANQAGENLGTLNGKPATLVTCLSGRSVDHPTSVHCQTLGSTMARMHVAGMDFTASGKNHRDATWRLHTANMVMPHLSKDDQGLLQETLTMQAALDYAHLPKSVVHADLFRDNVLFDGDSLGGIIDFYYACQDAMLYDLAIAVNDWCVLADGSLDALKTSALLRGYDSIRPLTEHERLAWPSMLKIAALRFWLSRLYDFYFPQEGELTHAKDPNYFQRILSSHKQAGASLANVWL